MDQQTTFRRLLVGREVVTSLRSLLQLRATKKVYARAATLVMMSALSGSVTPHCEAVKVGLTLAPEVPGDRCQTLH